jgi:hypothetical protein
MACHQHEGRLEDNLPAIGEPGVFYGQQTPKFEINSTARSDTSIKLDLTGIRMPITMGDHFIGNGKGVLNTGAFVGGSALILTSVNQREKSEYTCRV